ncbi:MAG TPA: type II toxin-antitoxin system VapC family toxin [Candidatus Solibacter sp.]|nr:type II toxin-antitoxin system VapC family toxin [Candidatus Solibacter sp.]
MKVLLDTHALIWWMRDDARLSPAAAAIVRDHRNEILVSAAVGWEMAIKINLGKIRPASLLDDLELVIAHEAFVELPVSLAHSVRAGMLPCHHRDPFDRLLAAQAQLLDLPILSADQLLDQYGIQRVW